MKKLLSFTLALLVLFSAFTACDSGKKPSTTPEATPTAPDETAPVTPEIVDATYKLSDKKLVESSIRTLGRTAVTSTGLNCDDSASGIEFNAYIEGDLKIAFQVSKASYNDESWLKTESFFTVYVDGVRSEQRIRANAGISTQTVASFESGAVHNIKIVKQTESHCALATLQTVAFRGYFDAKPADKELYIEFIGDSITSGFGNLCGPTDSGAGEALMQDATQTYAYLTAELLGADVSMVSCSGMGIAKGWRPYTADNFFKAESYYRNKEAALDETRTPDIVIINLGTNDKSKGSTYADLQKKIPDLINAVYDKYGKDTPIVWVSGMMGQACSFEVGKITKSVYGGEDGKIYTISLPQNNQGGGGHPSLRAHKDSSVILVNYLKEKGLVK